MVRKYFDEAPLMQVPGLQNGGAGCEHGGEVGDDMLMGFKGGGSFFSQVSDAIVHLLQ